VFAGVGTVMIEYPKDENHTPAAECRAILLQKASRVFARSGGSAGCTMVLAIDNVTTCYLYGI
jgi:hypothetical protein